ncbi:MAG: xanthine dehydrogenase family protein molybdopterin-binding subunit [Caldilineaceae bacterium SB0664_bin_27]|uniref:Xanthine dehydrogenase family protein molybdopterin-binding subunit n=1 Tax=Caldilineaceae bacterium SB0664_bin_27 TaxID=2605260 RepID=A0A6B0YX62_9CHLR|nr:xanthine dehydrogenase family protein molybdopterin-binding subunit [Caldilineaceae bacterium SB0664_bin_27]
MKQDRDHSEQAGPPASSHNGNDEAQKGERAEATPAMRRRWRLTRRGFLIGLGAAGAGLAVGGYFGRPILHGIMAESMAEAEHAGSSFMQLPDEPPFWLEVLEDSRIRLSLTKVEMGQGVHTSIAQIAVEELGIRWDDLVVEQADTSSKLVDGFGTGGSFSVATSYGPLRRAAAGMRSLLQREAAVVLKRPEAALRVAGRGFAVADSPEIKADFYSLAGAVTSWDLPEEEALQLKATNEFTVVGQPVARIDIPDKVTGQAVYGYDMRVPNMLYGAVARPPTLEAKLVGASAGEAAVMEGVEEIVIDVENGFVGVAASSRSAAWSAVKAMETEWDEGHLWQQEEIEALIEPAGEGGITIQREGNTAGVLGRETAITATYRSPFAVQAPLEAPAALADVLDDQVTVWVSTQSHERAKGLIAEELGVEADTVRVVPTYLGGGFGAKLDTGVAVEAARLSKAAGAPVHVGWDRTEAMLHGYLRPPTKSVISGALDGNGRIVAMEHRQGSSDVAFSFMPEFMEVVLGADFGATVGARIDYDVPNRTVTAWRKTLPVWTGWWRGLGLFANTFAVESFVDELAAAAGADPLQFRLDHLPDSPAGGRKRAVLEAVAELSGWGTAPPESRARGVACFGSNTVVAQVAEVSVDEESGEITVHRVDCAVDCGLVVNPDGAKAQIEGNVMWGVGSTLIEQAYVKDGRLELSNFESYPLLTMRRAPDVRSVLVDTGIDTPYGMGEPPIGPVGAAIGNAFTAATGRRVRTLPMTPARVLDTLAGGGS